MRRLALLIACLAVAASISGVNNGFTFDDVHVIVKNPGLHTLSNAGNLFFVSYWRPEYGSFLYRPLTSLAFAAQWVIGNGSPIPFHVVSILLYIACSAALYRLALVVVPPRAAVFAAAFFAIHPLHVEAVANITGQSELCVALITILVVDYYIRIRRARIPAWRDIAVIAGSYLLACGFKEHAIVLPGLLAAAELVVVEDERPVVARIRLLLPLLFALIAVAGGFVVVRHLILVGVADDSTSPLLRGQGFGPRLFTMLSVVMEWVRLFFWPADLSADYSFSRLRVHTAFSPVMIPGVLALAGTSWLAIILRRSCRGFTFGMSWAGLALLIPSNLIVVTGFVLAERTLFLASAGIALCIGVGMHALLGVAERSRNVTRYFVTAALFAVVAAAIIRSASRSLVWHDNERLFRQTVEDVPSSGRAHWMLAAQLFETGKRGPEVFNEMDIAVALVGNREVAMLGYAGDLFATSGQCQHALSFYLGALAMTPDDVRVRVNTSRCLINLGRASEAKAVALAGGVENMRDPRLQNVARSADSLQRNDGRQ